MTRCTRCRGEVPRRAPIFQPSHYMRWGTALLLSVAAALSAGALVAQPKDQKPADAKNELESAGKTKNDQAEINVDSKAIRQKLLTRTDLKVDKLPLREVVKKLSEQHAIPIKLDEKGLKKAGVSAQGPVTILIQNVTLSEALQQILKDFGLHFGVVDGAILITNHRAETDSKVADVEALAAGVAIEVVLNPAQQQQLIRQYRMLLNAVLHFTRTVGQATPKQMQ
ncbi:MAG: hypothetical protein HY290_10375, partial [Planctomycetia bacterium]|nr:hypothetical protein [Planctomycetia bacterium]